MVVDLTTELGVDKQTYYLYSSDHGFQLGEFNMPMDKVSDPQAQQARRIPVNKLLTRICLLPLSRPAQTHKRNVYEFDVSTDPHVDIYGKLARHMIHVLSIFSSSTDSLPLFVSCCLCNNPNHHR